MPLVLSVTGANRHNSMTFETLVDAIPAIPSLPGRPWQCPHKLHADKVYGLRCFRKHLKRHGILARIARRGVKSSEKQDRHRLVVERTYAWPAGFGKLRIRFERYPLLTLCSSRACAVICLRFAELFC